MTHSSPIRLSRRQVHMLAGAARGQTNEQIAAALGVKHATVSSTLLRAGRMLGTGSRAGMVHRAYQEGFLTGLVPEYRPALQLSRAQAAVLRGLAQGYSACEIAEILEVSPNTVKTHLRKLFIALHATSRSHAVALGWQHDLLRSSSILEGADHLPAAV
ncbi:helix-turn-helix transcriptional regulator [Streptacidiphilus sp. 4-A2]|nr:helix-turn-helix transcriptional regulator [Streptacidiphilus sp. 4-A2]